MNAVALTAALESTLTCSNWIVTADVLAAAHALWAVRADLVGSPRFSVVAVLLWLRRCPVGERLGSDSRSKVLFATSGVRGLAAA